MRRFAFLAALALLAGVAIAACGSARSPGPHAGELLYWHVTSSDLQFANCSDDPEFRDAAVPIEVKANSYLIYRVDKDDTVATAMECATFDPSSCSPSDSGVTFAITNHELTRTDESKAPLGRQGCMLDSIEQWTMTDKGLDLSVEITDTFSEVDNPAACEAAEASIRSTSPNDAGLNGCVMTYTLGATLR